MLIGIITKINSVLALMILYYHPKFENAAIHGAWDILSTTSGYGTKKQYKNKTNKKQKQKTNKNKKQTNNKKQKQQQQT